MTDAKTHAVELYIHRTDMSLRTICAKCGLHSETVVNAVCALHGEGALRKGRNRTTAESAQLTAAVRRAYAECGSFAGASRVTGVSATTVRRVLEQAGDIDAPQPKAPPQPQCDLCSILLEYDDERTEDGLIVHPPSGADAGRCWRCKRDYAPTATLADWEEGG